MVKSPPARRGARIRRLGREDPLEKEMAARSSTLAGNPLDRGACGLQSVGSRASGTTEPAHGRCLVQGGGGVQRGGERG